MRSDAFRNRRKPTDLPDEAPFFGPSVGVRTPSVVKSAFPIFMGGGTVEERFFQLRTYVLDKKTNTKLSELTWGLRIEAQTPAPEALKYERMGQGP